MKYNTGLVIVVLLVALPLFAHLDQLPIQLWDESRLAVNALEMYQNNNWLVTKFLHKPELWNTKPPLMIWLQVICMKVVGVNELAVRLPSALAALSTCILLYWLCARKLKLPWLGIVSCFMLVTSSGFVGGHLSRTGDYDALLTALIFGYTVNYFLFIEEENKKKLVYMFILLTLAVLTKSSAALLPLPTLFFYTLYRKKIAVVFKSKEFYIGIALFLISVVSYYLFREHYNPGYIKTVIANEFGGLYLTTQQGHYEKPSFYLYNAVNDRFIYWWYFVPFGALLAFFENNLVKRLLFLSTIFIINYYFILSGSATKLWWYDMPVYPFLVLISGYCVYQIFNFIFLQLPIRNVIVVVAALVFIAVMRPYSSIIKYAFNPRANFNQNSDMVEYLQDVYRGKRKLTGNTLPVIEQNVTWYMEALQLKGLQIDHTSADVFSIGQKPIVYENDIRNYIDQHYTYEVIEKWKAVTVYKITGTK